MNILLATEVIQPGGAETFVLRLANALQQRGNNVCVFVLYKDEYNKELHDAVAPDVRVYWPKIGLSKLAKKLDGLLFRLKIDYSIRNAFIKKALKKTLQGTQTEIIHSNLLKVDKICTEVGDELGIPAITTIHGDYLQFYNKIKHNKRIPLLKYRIKAKKNLTTLKKVVCISDKQLSFFQNHFPEQTKNKLCKIYNGYEKPDILSKSSSFKNDLGIAPGDFVFGMASRGIKEKGWDTAIQAFLLLKSPNIHLVLLGESDYINSLRSKYAVHNNIHFVGHSHEPLEWINIFDAGLLPSTYASESLPTVIIEYLCCNKPVIASDAGEIKNMIITEGKQSGIIVPIKENKIAITELARAMQCYLDDKVCYNQHKANAAICFEQFNMDKCVNSYLDTYKKAMQ